MAGQVLYFLGAKTGLFGGTCIAIHHLACGWNGIVAGEPSLYGKISGGKVGWIHEKALENSEEL